MISVLPRFGPATWAARHAKTRSYLLALLSLLVVTSAWVCATGVLSTDAPAAASGRESVTVSEVTTAQEAHDTAEAVRQDSSRCEAPGSPSPCRKVLVPQPDLRLPETTAPAALTAALPVSVPHALSADVCRDVVTSGLSPPPGRAATDRLRI